MGWKVRTSGSQSRRVRSRVNCLSAWPIGQLANNAGGLNERRDERLIDGRTVKRSLLWVWQKSCQVVTFNWAKRNGVTVNVLPFLPFFCSFTCSIGESRALRPPRFTVQQRCEGEMMMPFVAKPTNLPCRSFYHGRSGPPTSLESFTMGQWQGSGSREGR